MLKETNASEGNPKLSLSVFREVPLSVLEMMQLTFSESVDVLTCLFHTILFNRAFSKVKPIDAKIDFFDIDYVKISDNILDKQLNEMIINALKPCYYTKTEIELDLKLSFYYTKEDKNIFFSKVNKCLWEQWIIPVKIIKENKVNKENKQRKETQANLVKKNLLAIVNNCNITLDKIVVPAFKKEYGLCYPFDITNAKTPNTFFEAVKKTFGNISPNSFW